jgi:hypothetical protein
MATIFIRVRVPDDQIKKEAEDAIPKIEKFFDDHPRRLTCVVQLWYDQMAKVRRGQVKEDVERYRDEALARGHK